ncbi:alpha/beta fold hydrolase [Rhodococcus sp. G-MC3]|uniref:alpha/beta fold hydrolase n=1 Tax=Rhodococcus sp. G-MC3 TaxID=3046209 RepID=UPI003FA6BFE3
MYYSEVGRGDPVVFIHGNPTSSYLWRNITGVVAGAGYRCIAVDLIGMGRSGQSQSGYRLKDHIDHVRNFLEALDLRSVTLVGHDWGAVIALGRVS